MGQVLGNQNSQAWRPAHLLGIGGVWVLKGTFFYWTPHWVLGDIQLEGGTLGSLLISDMGYT